MNRLPKFCPQCGGLLGLQLHDGRERPICSACGYVVYLNPAPSVAAILFQEGRVLLVKRRLDPGCGLWCLPGGFIEASETPEAAVVREVGEETGLLCRPLKLLDAHAVLGGFYGDILVLCYLVEIVGGDLTAGCDAEEAAFFDSRDLPRIAFDIHEQFILSWLSDKVEISPSANRTTMRRGYLSKG